MTCKGVTFRLAKGAHLDSRAQYKNNVMRINLLLLASIICVLSSYSKNNIIIGKTKTDSVGMTEVRPVSEVSHISLYNQHFKYRQKNIIGASGTDSVFSRSVVTERPGELADKLGDDVHYIDSLAISGPLNDSDFYTLWQASYYDTLCVINLENAEIVGNEVPSHAFYHPEIQVKDGGSFIYVPRLKNIILPESVKGIGRFAFTYTTFMQEINIPDSLNYLEEDAFACSSIQKDSLAFPEGFERIGREAFFDCEYVGGNVHLPSTIKSIGMYAFFATKITNINLPEGLDTIEERAFQTCLYLKEAIIPNSCQLFGTRHFMFDEALEKLHLPEGLDRIPEKMLWGCLNLRDINIPASVRKIEPWSMTYNYNVRSLELPEGLDVIQEGALYGLHGLETIVFPSTLKELGNSSCIDWHSIQQIYCKAQIPPSCGNAVFGPDESEPEFNTPSDIPVYVPKGTADLYRNAVGWNYFTNFIETDDFPTSVESTLATISMEVYGHNGTIVIKSQGSPASYAIYSISGKLINYGTTEHGQSQMSLPHGIYIVKAGCKKYKIIL